MTLQSSQHEADQQDKMASLLQLQRHPIIALKTSVEFVHHYLSKHRDHILNERAKELAKKQVTGCYGVPYCV
ncbi:hypothetical protein E2C01_075489 [Portunus trituberculatus]|uniref:Uncharacterized protein n=1 Tax=Portunus trituberculatus TaxID=210409 RepID=A0A5B7IAT6_PORTR|nr:hypothetical protein [Portunus trituberculatus]